MTIASTDLVVHLPHLRRYALRLLRNRDAANDLVQETLARALRYLDRYLPTGSLQGWLISIMKKQFRQSRRRHLRDCPIGVNERGVAREEAGLPGRREGPQGDARALRELSG